MIGAIGDALRVLSGVLRLLRPTWLLRMLRLLRLLMPVRCMRWTRITWLIATWVRSTWTTLARKGGRISVRIVVHEAAQRGDDREC